MIETMQNPLYFLDNKPYINMTNACTNACVFCIRNEKDDVQGTPMWLNHEVYAQDVIEQIENNIKKVLNAGSIVFCGYGEPLIKLDEVVEISKYLKKNYPDLKIRINTNGHANAIHKKNVVPLLAPYIDEISISLNAQNEKTYNEISQPKIENAYEEVKRFIRACVEAKITTFASVVDNVPNYPIDIERCKVISESLQARFRVRDFIENGYE